ncbi:MAG: glycosyltransferase [Aphanocapsa sp. GSE-SYN-MK-11-07L]|jgi:glycosyltransferase involved in cell wall biosynthesis|nr:glycosyltransferase [Aphanocapsa sp. GSE-SYN-MK-11-07L]
MKVLISAYSCEPGKGSERGVGWNVAREVARHHEVWVLTRPDESREAIDAELAANPAPNLHFVYFTLPFWQDSLRWGQSGAMQLHYYLWQIQAYIVGRKLHREIKFDLIHHVTFVRYSSPSFLALLPVPFVWGPVGGGESAPLSFWADFSWKNKLYESLRWAWRSLGELDPFTRLTAQRSAIAYATTEDTAQRLRKLGASRIVRLSESGMSQAELEQLSQCPPPTNSPVRFINIARLLHWKGIYLGIRAFAQANLPDAEYWVLGEGPELERLQALTLDLGITDQVKFFGLLPREEVLIKLGECTALVHPSLHDSGGWVPLEAMAAGRPIICLDLGGPSELVKPAIGLKVAANSPEQAVSDLATAMAKLAEDRNLCIQMGQAGQQKVKELYSWEAKGTLFAHIYKDMCTYE